MATGKRVLPDVGQVETQTIVKYVHPTAGIVYEGAYTRGPLPTEPIEGDGYFKVVTEWICPDCGDVHLDQEQIDPTLWECA